MRSFGKTIRAQRQKLKLTQRQVAEAVDVSDAYICSLESDKKSPPPYHTVAAIADTLELDAERLWSIAVIHREEQAMAKSRRKTMSRKRNSEGGNDRLQKENATVIPDNQINAFFDLPENQVPTFALVQKQPKDMTMEEKRAVYQAINIARKAVSDEMDKSTGSS
jgi:transcriptional regulator with XRE-family HTH domain